MSCQICVEVCPFDAIKMDQEFELSTTDRFDGLLVHKQDLAKPNTYYHKIRPTEATAVDAQLAHERAQQEAAKAKAAAPPTPARPVAPALPAGAAGRPSPSAVASVLTPPTTPPARQPVEAK
jgi:NADH-quinone oxidoreductase subunit I